VRLIIGNKNYSSWSLRSWLLLKEAGLEFDEHRIPLNLPSAAAALADASPACRVPVLMLNDQAIWDTLAIAETVAEGWPEKELWPTEAKSRAHARSISAEMHAGFAAIRELMPMNCRALGRKVTLPDELTADIDRIFEIWTQCQQQYGGLGRWLFGQFSIADAMFAPVVLRFRTYGINLPESASAYPARLLESNAIQAWLADAEPETEVIEVEELGQ
jgi:glutathione S-transferase